MITKKQAKKWFCDSVICDVTQNYKECNKKPCNSLYQFLLKGKKKGCIKTKDRNWEEDNGHSKHSK